MLLVYYCKKFALINCFCTIFGGDHTLRHHLLLYSLLESNPCLACRRWKDDNTILYLYSCSLWFDYLCPDLFLRTILASWSKYGAMRHYNKPVILSWHIWYLISHLPTYHFKFFNFPATNQIMSADCWIVTFLSFIVILTNVTPLNKLSNLWIILILIFVKLYNKAHF